MISMNVLTVRPTLLTGDSNCAQEQRKSRLYDCGVWTRLSPVSLSFNVLMTLVIGRVILCLLVGCRLAAVDCMQLLLSLNGNCH